MLKAYSNRLKGRNILINETSFKFDKDGYCTCQEIGGAISDFELMLKTKHGIHLVPEEVPEEVEDQINQPEAMEPEAMEPEAMEPEDIQEFDEDPFEGLAAVPKWIIGSPTPEPKEEPKKVSKKSKKGKSTGKD